MNRMTSVHAVCCAALGLVLAGCGDKAKPDPSAGAPPPAKVERENDSSMVHVDRPEQFALAVAASFQAAPELSATGVVSPTYRAACRWSRWFRAGLLKSTPAWGTR